MTSINPLYKLTQAIDEGMNEVRYHKANGGVVIELAHTITSDNTVSLFVPDDADFLLWSESDDQQVNSFHT